MEADNVWAQFDLPPNLKPFLVEDHNICQHHASYSQEEAVRSGSGVVLAIPSGQDKALPLYVANLGTGKVKMLIEGQVEIELTNLGISNVNMTPSSVDELQRALESVSPPEISTRLQTSWSEIIHIQSLAYSQSSIYGNFKCMLMSGMTTRFSTWILTSQTPSWN